MPRIFTILLLWSCAGLSAAEAPAIPRVALEPPPGWRDVTPAKHDPSLLLALKGPEASSFVLTRLHPLNRSNRAVARGFLIDVLTGVNERTKLGFVPAGAMQTKTFKNDLTVDYLLINLKDKPRMILALADAGGLTMLGALTSAIPETLLPSFMGEIAVSNGAQRAASALDRAASSDGQLLIDLPMGTGARPLSDLEKSKGFVLAIQGMSSELLFLKVPDSNSGGHDEAQAVQATLASLKGVEAASISAVRSATTNAGPSAVFATAAIADGAGKTRFAGGFLPWCYWGYSVFAKGPNADQLLKSSLQGLARGPSADPKLVSATPKLSISGDRKNYPLLLGALLAATGLAALALRVWKR